jgi:hypothetical protein
MTAPTGEGPTSLERVLGMLSLTVDDGDLVASSVAAVNSLVRGWLTPAPDGEWAPHHTYGATLLAARMYRRKDSAEGVVAFGVEGATYVSRNDPDVALLLGLGAYQTPRVG